MSYHITAILGIAAFFIGIAIRRGIDKTRLRFHLAGRPLVLRLIAIFELAVGSIVAVASLLVAYSVVTQYAELKEKLAPFQISPEQLLASILAIALLAIVAGIGLWRENQWGWRIAVFAIGIQTVRNAYSLLNHLLPGRLGLSEAFYYVQHSLRALVGALMLLYLFRTSVMQYCGVDSDRRRHVLWLIGSIVSAIGLELLLR